MHETEADDDHVVPLEQRGGRGVAHAVDLLVDGRVLLDVGVRGREIRLGLVVVVIGDEVLHRVPGEKLLELVVELGGQRLVVRDHKRGPLDLLDHVRHGEGLARARYPEQDLVFEPLDDAVGKLLDRLGLVAGRRIVRCYFEFRHKHILLDNRGEVNKGEIADNGRFLRLRRAVEPCVRGRQDNDDGLFWDSSGNAW